MARSRFLIELACTGEVERRSRMPTYSMNLAWLTDLPVCNTRSFLCGNGPLWINRVEILLFYFLQYTSLWHRLFVQFLPKSVSISTPCSTKHILTDNVNVINICLYDLLDWYSYIVVFILIIAEVFQNRVCFLISYKFR